MLPIVFYHTTDEKDSAGEEAATDTRWRSCGAAESHPVVTHGKRHQGEQAHHQPSAHNCELTTKGTMATDGQVTPARALDAAAGRVSEEESDKIYASVEKIEDPAERRRLRRDMIWEACENNNVRYIQFVWRAFSHPFSDPEKFADATVAALKDSGHHDADRHHELLRSVADDDSDGDTWMWRGDGDSDSE